ncbi:MAG: hypothetical protein ACRDSZ_13505 [Pseudonocardiaceae bacterium]
MVSGLLRCVLVRARREDVCGVDDEVRCQAVVLDQVVGLVAAYRRAVWGADRLRVALVAAGLDPADATVVAGLGEDGEPAVHVTALPVLAVQLSASIAGDQASKPWRDDPNVA